MSEELRAAAERYVSNDYQHKWQRFQDAKTLALALINLRFVTETRCSKCGLTTVENRQKYCGDGSDKDNGHAWRRSIVSVRPAE